MYTSKHAITSADVLNDRVLPFFEEYEIPVLHMLTARGTEINGRLENHEYELYLQLENIDNSKTKVRHPQSNGICERLHRTRQVAKISNSYFELEPSPLIGNNLVRSYAHRGTVAFANPKYR